MCVTYWLSLASLFYMPSLLVLVAPHTTDRTGVYGRWDFFYIHFVQTFHRDIRELALGSGVVRKHMDRVKRIWYLSPMRAAKIQASLRIRAVSPEPSLLAYTSSESRGTFRQKTRSLAPLNGWACAVTVCHDGMFEDTNSLDGAHIKLLGPMNGI